jgi:predicted transcriptional regulator
MKTAVSLPDELFNAADQLASRLGLTRSRLFSTAVAEFIARHKTSRITERLNAVYAAEESRLDPDVKHAGDETLRRSAW